MAYTVLWFSRKDPHAASRTMHVTRLSIIAVVLFLLVVLPVLAFYLGYIYMAPENMQQRLERQIVEVTNSAKQTQELEKELMALKEKYNALQVENLTEINKRAEAEARVSMVETARSAALERAKKLEGQNADLRGQLDIFQDILQPSSETLPVQCYNVSVQETSDGIKYSLSLLKTDNKDTRELEMDLQVRVLVGANVATLNETEIAKKDRLHEVKMARLLTTSGSVDGSFGKDGVRVLDIRGYGSKKDDKLMTHCWKSF